MKIQRTMYGKLLEYEWKGKKVNYNTHLHIRIDDDTKAKLKAIAEYKMYKGTSKIIKEALENEIAKYEFVEVTNVGDNGKTYKVGNVL